MQIEPNGRLFSLLVTFAATLLSCGIALGAQAPQVTPEATCPSCDDLNPCTADWCDGSTGTCQHRPLFCDDLNPCTVDSCDPSTVTCRHDPLNCDDQNPCTIDSCEMIYPGAGGCTHSNLPDGMACDDGNSCTADDACSPILDAAIQCAGQVQPPGTACDDGNSCTASDTCDEAGQCAGTPLTAGSPCDDQSACTSQDTCIAPLGAVACQGSPRDCSDSDLCTQDLCNPATGQCTHPPVDCDDGNSCTQDSCDPATAVCLRTNLSGFCDDGNPCNDRYIPDFCMGGNCIGGPSNDYVCDDGVPCTHDACRLDLGGCINTPDRSLCPPDFECGNYVCDPTYPGGYPNNVRGCRWQYHNNGCFSDVCAERHCEQASCMRWDLNGNPCDDLDICTRNDVCFAGNCHGRQVCDDNNPCTTDTCDPATLTCSCTNNTGSCNDGNTCTHPDVCSNGICQSGPLMNCDDGNLCTTDRCTTWGTCDHLDACDDHNYCTADSCDPATGCSHQPITAPCNDGNACTLGDACGNGVCQSGTLVNCDLARCCDDHNVCTVDSCDPVTGCSHEPGLEICNGLDDDCDGLVDENRVQANCIINPSTLNLNAQGNMASMTCKLFDVCDLGNPVPIPGSTIGQVHISRVDGADSSSDDVTLPDPSTLPCPDPVLGMLYERGISENLAARDVAHANVTFKFNQPSDGDCSTLDGDRQDISARLTAIPDNTSATVCISGKIGGADFQACMLMLVRNKGLR